jgi:hypothetical protein
VKTATSVKDAEAQSGSIFAAFSRQGQQPVHPSHRSLSNTEIRCVFRFFIYPSLLMKSRACIVKWVTENSRPVYIVKDREVQTLVTAGRPHAVVPSPSTVRRDINMSFVKCREKVGKLLKVRDTSAVSPGAVNEV